MSLCDALSLAKQTKILLKIDPENHHVVKRYVGGTV